MKIFIKTLKGTRFEIEVKLEDTVADVKKNIEKVQGLDIYPAAQQMLIHQGKVLNDASTLEESEVAENSFIVVMLSKNKTAPTGSTSGSGAPESQPVVPPALAPASTAPQTPTPTVEPAPTAPSVPPVEAPASAVSDAYGQAASNVVAGSNLDSTIQQILDMGGGSWDRDTVARALRAAFNNPERAVEYLYSGIPEQTEVAPVALAPTSGQAANPPAQPPQPTVSSSMPNATPLDLFPQGIPNLGSNANPRSFDFLRTSRQFQTLRSMVQANPHILQPMLQELGKQNPQLMRMIEERQADFIRLLNEPVEGEGSFLPELASEAPQAVTVTAEEHEAIERLEAMGFRRETVLQVYFACNKDEELTANYLLDHMDELNEDEEMS